MRPHATDTRTVGVKNSYVARSQNLEAPPLHPCLQPIITKSIILAFLHCYHIRPLGRAYGPASPSHGKRKEREGGEEKQQARIDPGAPFESRRRRISTTTMPTYEKMEDWLQQSQLLLEARPTTVSS